MASCNEVSETVLEDWKDPVICGEGPTLENFVYDWMGGRKAEWNVNLVTKLTEKIKKEAEERWRYLPKYDTYYWNESIWRKLRNLSFRWGRAQRKRKRNGDFETEEEASVRLLAQQKRERKMAKQNTRRRSVGQNQEHKRHSQSVYRSSLFNNEYALP